MKYYDNKIYPIALVLSNDVDSLNKYYTDIEGNDVENKTTPEAYTVPLNRRTTEYNAMAVGIVFNVPITMKLAAHEGLHAVMLMARQLGFVLDYSSEECFAYLLEWIMECIEDYKQIMNNE